MAAAACIGTACAFGAWSPPPRRVHHRVLLQNVAIQTARLVVVPGDTVTWTNLDIVPHTVTATSGRWDSGNIASTARWSHIITAADTGQYFCRYHPTMRATLVGR